MATKLSPVLEAQAWMETMCREQRPHSYHPRRCKPVASASVDGSSTTTSTPWSTTKSSFNFADLHLERSPRLPAAGLPQSLLSYRTLSMARTDAFSSSLSEPVPAAVRTDGEESRADDFERRSVDMTATMWPGCATQKLCSFLASPARGGYGTATPMSSRSPRQLPPVRLPDNARDSGAEACLPAVWQPPSSSRGVLRTPMRAAESFPRPAAAMVAAAPTHHQNGASYSPRNSGLPSCWQPPACGQGLRQALEPIEPNAHASVGVPLESRRGTSRSGRQTRQTPNIGGSRAAIMSSPRACGWSQDLFTAAA